MFVCCVCCQAEVSATGWSLDQRSYTDCGASLCVIKKPRETRPQPALGCSAREKKKKLTLLCLKPRHVSGVKRPSSRGTTLAVFGVSCVGSTSARTSHQKLLV
jgi:hypothetical protein